MKSYTIEQIKKYLLKSESLGDALHYCDEKHLNKAQEEPIYSELEEEADKEYDKDDEDWN